MHFRNLCYLSVVPDHNALIVLSSLQVESSILEFFGPRVILLSIPNDQTYVSLSISSLEIFDYLVVAIITFSSYKKYKQQPLDKKIII